MLAYDPEGTTSKSCSESESEQEQASYSYSSDDELGNAGIKKRSRSDESDSENGGDVNKKEKTDGNEEGLEEAKEEQKEEVKEEQKEVAPAGSDGQVNEVGQQDTHKEINAQNDYNESMEEIDEDEDICDF